MNILFSISVVNSVSCMCMVCRLNLFSYSRVRVNVVSIRLKFSMLLIFSCLCLLWFLGNICVFSMKVVNVSMLLMVNILCYFNVCSSRFVSSGFSVNFVLNVVFSRVKIWLCIGFC